jgi:hypothetical protein
MTKKFPVLRESYQVLALPTDGRFLALLGVRRSYFSAGSAYH